MPTQPGTIAAVTGVSTKVPDELKMPRTNYSDKAPNTSNEEFLARIANNVKTFPDPAEEYVPSLLQIVLLLNQFQDSTI